MENLAVDLLDYRFLGVAVRAWLLLLASWVVFTTALVILRRFIVWRVDKTAARTQSVVTELAADVLQRTYSLFLVGLGLFFAVSVAPLTPGMAHYIGWVAFVLLLIQIIVWGNFAISEWLRRYRERKLEEDAAAVTSMQAVAFVTRLALYSIVFLMALDNFGVDITALIAGLGIGGIAVALALQNVLSDLFASLSIVLDKPFVVGDFLIVDECLGTVEMIGLKTTRIRSLSGEQVVIANSDLLNSRIRNFKRMFQRRIVFSFGVVYQTSYEKLKQIPEFVREIVESLEDTRFDRAHFKEYGDFSLNFEVVYFVLVPDFNVYMDRQQAINLALFKRFEEDGIEFAYPTQTVFVQPVANGLPEATVHKSN